MHNKINALPITLDRKATVYEGVGDNNTDCFDLEYGDKVILTSDGSNVEYWNGIYIDDRHRPLSELQIELSITPENFMKFSHGEDTFVDLILIDSNKLSVVITTQFDTIYDEVHTIR